MNFLTASVLLKEHGYPAMSNEPRAHVAANPVLNMYSARRPERQRWQQQRGRPRDWIRSSRLLRKFWPARVLAHHQMLR
jgi:hypothetical protein